MGKSSVILFFTLLAIDMSSQVASSAHEGRQGFTENRGQLYNTIGNPVPEIKFKADFSSYSVYFSKNRFSYVLSDAAAYARAKNATPIRKLKNKHPDSKPFATTYRIDMEFLGADTSAEMNTGDELGGYDNFYFAHCPNGVTNVPTFSSITYKELYQGVNMEVMYSENGAMKYNLIIEPGADPSQIKMLYRGADDVEVENGHLIIRNSVHDLTEYIPAIFQQTPNGKVDVKGNYVVTKTADGFLVQIVPGHFDPSLELVIDPTTWVTYYGGNSGDESSGVTADAAGDEYTCGMTGSTTFPVTPGAFQTTMSTLYDCVLIKFGPTGTRQWATFFGGNNTDVPLDVMCDHNGAIIMTGNTTSSDFPITVGCFQNADAGFEDAFVAKFNPSGTLNFSTYFGGTDFDSGNSIAIDSQNNILITGVAGNAFPVSAGAYQTANGGLGIGYVQSTFGFGPGDAFILKLSPTGSRLWATYVGG
ncbi:MAG TPA: SBBP repeat-containing protein, partial [Bacteroidia bacterium]|nr:SBBP repeat-containing protein [Bacteroidia bacterium]